MGIQHILKFLSVKKRQKLLYVHRSVVVSKTIINIFTTVKIIVNKTNRKKQKQRECKKEKTKCNKQKC